MKKYFKYILAIIIVYVIVDIASFYVLKSAYNTKEYSTESKEFSIQIDEAKATFVNGYIKGKVRNIQSKHLSNKYLKIDAYSKRDVLLGTKFVEIPTLVPGESADINASFNYEQIDNLKISTIDESELPEGALDFNFDNPDDAKITWAVILGAFILLIDGGFTWVLLL